MMTAAKMLGVALVVVVMCGDVVRTAVIEGVAQGSYGRGTTGGFGGSPGLSGGEGQPSPYSFEYKVQDAESGNDYGQRESGDGAGGVQGEYHVLLPDGRRQTVTYTADDANGFNAEVKYDGEAAPGGGGGAPTRPGGGAGGGAGGGGGGYPRPGGGATSPVYLPPNGK